MGTIDSNVALITLTEVKEFLRIGTGTTDDALLNSLINEISMRVRNYCGRKFLKGKYTEVYTGNGSRELILNNYPVTAVDKLYIDQNSSFTADTEVSSDSYRIDEQAGIIMLYNQYSNFGSSFGNVKIIYDVGWLLADIPYDIRLAVKKWIAIVYQKTKDRRYGIQGETVGDKTINYIHEEIPVSIKGLLAPYLFRGANPNLVNSSYEKEIEGD